MGCMCDGGCLFIALSYAGMDASVRMHVSHPVPQFRGWPFTVHEPFTHAHHGEGITFSQLPNGRDK